MNIKFRGKCLKNGNWYYGGYAETGVNEYCVAYIIANSSNGLMPVEVDCSTVGQFTGSYDKDGKEIYVGDVLALWDINDKGLFYVSLDKNGWGYHFTYKNISGYACSTHIMDNIVVIGNINENPELLS